MIKKIFGILPADLVLRNDVYEVAQRFYLVLSTDRISTNEFSDFGSFSLL